MKKISKFLPILVLVMDI
ncbi:SHP2/SHP3 family peptide pheromone, partial [Streptococcus pneumoniae]|nr:SHP2/SHP3 family peptide pheromone [Streptococcus pneumoniae]HES9808771.1 SHP2/SHP3 family peptide pheromone [Streptococcus pneumoniae]HEU8952883.1 SHP2/SHP3 family peptide pheromone [Streptococcus pneumoniae]